MQVSNWLRCRQHLDRVLAVVIGLLVSPVVVVLGVLVRLEDGGPAFITVPRVGRGGTVFPMWKIRSMRVETPEGRATGASLTASADRRVTRVGRLLRAGHLDELTQLYNVARGEMCLLGPRPEAPDFVDLEDAGWRSALAAAPGIAGPTQLIVGEWELTQIDVDDHGAAYRDVVVPVKVAIDGWYVRSASPLLDLLVLRSLVGSVLTGRDPATLRRRVERHVPRAAIAREDLAG